MYHEMSDICKYHMNSYGSNSKSGYLPLSIFPYTSAHLFSYSNFKSVQLYCIHIYTRSALIIGNQNKYC